MHIYTQTYQCMYIYRSTGATYCARSTQQYKAVKVRQWTKYWHWKLRSNTVALQSAWKSSDYKSGICKGRQMEVWYLGNSDEDAQRKSRRRWRAKTPATNRSVDDGWAGTHSPCATTGVYIPIRWSPALLEAEHLHQVKNRDPGRRSLPIDLKGAKRSIYRRLDK